MTQLRSVIHRALIPPPLPARAPRRPTIFVIVLMLVGAGLPAWASGLAVNPASAQEGSFGLEVDTGSICASSQDVVVPAQTVTGALVEQACDAITAGSGVVISRTGSVDLSAGHTVVLDNGFSVQQGGTLRAGLDPSLAGVAYVEDDSPSSETSYRAEFHLDADSLTLGAGDRLEHFVAYDALGDPTVRVVIIPGPALVLEVLDSTGATLTSPGIALAPG